MDRTVTIYLFSAFLAFIPALIWLGIIFRKTKRRGLQTLVFLLGISAVIPVFFIQYFLDIFPQFDIVTFIQDGIQNQNINYLILFISVGITEELAKQKYIRALDKRYLLVQTVNESIQFSLVSALGFSFAENIFYIYNIWTNLSTQQLFIAYLFRSIFTTCAHMIFSGFFGYYYGIAKFSLNIREHSEWIGKKLYIQSFIARIFNMSKSEAFKETMILKGLFIAMGAHALFNFLLQLNYIVLVVLFVIMGYVLLRHLLKQKSGRLILVTDIDSQRESTMPKNDEDVVVELMGMWFQERRYVDVIHICERLLERDPDNKVVQLFKAKAIDKIDDNNVYGKILQKLFPPKNVVTLSKLIKLKEKGDT